jgi:DNA (cytosine-5)-methyltransferase 1
MKGSVIDVDVRPRTVLSLCAGYGGLERATAIACPGIRLVGSVERQAYAAAVLADRMVEGSVDPCPIWDDLESFDCRPYSGRVDLVVAGFPCQGASVAGKRLGTEDERWLWPEVFRIYREVGATWLFAENVPGLLSVNGGRACEEILRDLASCGLAAEWDCLPAGAVGAPHPRDRFFLLVADPERVAVRIESERDQRDRRGERATERESSKPRRRSSARTVADASGSGLEGAGHAEPSRDPEPRSPRSDGHATDADGSGLGSPERELPAREPDARGSGDGIAADAASLGREASELGREEAGQEGRSPTGSGGDASDAAGNELAPGRRADEHEERAHAERSGGEAADSDDSAERSPHGARSPEEDRRRADDAADGRASSSIAADADHESAGAERQLEPDEPGIAARGRAPSADRAPLYKARGGVITITLPRDPKSSDSPPRIEIEAYIRSGYPDGLMIRGLDTMLDLQLDCANVVIVKPRP